MKKMIIAWLLFALPAAVHAQMPPPEGVNQESSVQQTQQAPAQNAPGQNADEPGGFVPGADVRIITEGDRTIEEYSLNGHVYMVKIQHKGYPPYYLIDRDGDGRMDEQVSELMGPAVPPPAWTLFRW
jgi:hypothetical protein